MSSRSETALQSRGIIVLGMHRSGTSCLTGSLVLAGAFAGYDADLTGVSEENKKGFWERRDLRNYCDLLLQKSAADWWRLAEFSIEQIPAEVKARGNELAEEALRKLEFHAPWIVKEPRLCLLLPVFLELQRKPVCIHIVRNPLEVAESLKARNGIPIHEGIALWEQYNRSALLNAKDVPLLRISYAALLRHPEKAVNGLVERLQALGVEGLKRPEPAELANFVDRSLHRQRADKAITGEFLTPSQRRLWEALQLPQPVPLNILEASPTSLAVALHDLETTKESFDNVDKLRGSLNAQQRELDRLKHFDATLVAPLAAQIKELEGRLNTQSKEQLEQQRSLLEEQRSQLEQQRLQLEQQRVELEQQRTQLAQREAEKAELHGLQGQLAEQREISEKLKTQADRELSELQTRYEVDLAAWEAEKSSLAESLAERFREIAQLTKLLVERESRIDELSRSQSLLPGRLRQAGMASLMQRVRIRRSLRVQRRLLEESELFDADWYLKHYPDVAAAGVAPELHYLLDGAKEGRLPGPAFDGNAYLRLNADVRVSGENPLVHYLTFGQFEGRDAVLPLP